MCTISGRLSLETTPDESIHNNSIAISRLSDIARKGEARGKDGIGVFSSNVGLQHFDPFYTQDEDKKFTYENVSKFIVPMIHGTIDYICVHNRAVPESEQQNTNHTQPIETTSYVVIHNGIIANDQELFDSTEYDKSILRSSIDTEKFAWKLEHTKSLSPEKSLRELFLSIETQIKGSFAFAIYDKSTKEFLLTTNFQPLAYKIETESLYFSSLKEYLAYDFDKGTQYGLDKYILNTHIQDLKPYSYIYVDSKKNIHTGDLSKDQLYVEELSESERSFEIMYGNAASDYTHSKGLVLASGGLDTTVVAGIMKEDYNCKELVFLHFDYGHKAEARESKALQDVVDFYGAKLVTIKLDFLKELFKDSPLMTGKVDETGKGMEMSLEYVPTRNLMFLSLALSYAEVNGFHYIGFGGNLSESMSYSDTTSTFIEKFNSIIPNAIKTRGNIKVLDPLRDLLKHEIVAEGIRTQAPMNLTWSCYQDNGTGKHCGVCASCRLRKAGMARNNLDIEGV